MNYGTSFDLCCVSWETPPPSWLFGFASVVARWLSTRARTEARISSIMRLQKLSQGSRVSRRGWRRMLRRYVGSRKCSFSVKDMRKRRAAGTPPISYVMSFGGPEEDSFGVLIKPLPRRRWFVQGIEDMIIWSDLWSSRDGVFGWGAEEGRRLPSIWLFV